MDVLPGTIIFNEAGDHIITLEAWNEDDRAEKEASMNLDSTVAIYFNATIQENDYAPVGRTRVLKMLLTQLKQ